MLACIGIWAIAGLVLGLTAAFAKWPSSGSSFVVYLAVALGLVPLALLLLDALASSEAVVDLRGIKLDFSRAAVIRDTVGIPANVVAPGVMVADSGGVQIKAALAQIGTSEIARVDLRDGTAWWVTRLLALAAGAVRIGAPRALVFVGVEEESVEDVFLGWSTAESVLQAILDDKPEYRELYDRARAIADQVEAYAPFKLPTGALPAAVSPEASFYVQTKATLEHALLNEAVNRGLENVPDRLTIGRLRDLFGHCLHTTDVVDLEAAMDEQIAAILSGRAPFVAVVRARRLEGLLRREDGERFILRQLFEQSRNGGRRSVPSRTAV